MFNQNLVQKAWKFAVEKHKNQKYPGTDLPYITHIGAVCLELSNALTIEYSTECLNLATKLLERNSLKGSHSASFVNLSFATICAILHDVVEDTQTTLEEVEQLFGQHVASGVSALTKDSNIQDKFERTLDSLQRIKQEPKEVWMVKLADRIANLSDFPKHWKDERCISYIRESELILDYLKGASSVLQERLQEKIQEWKKHYNALDSVEKIEKTSAKVR